MIRVLSTVLLFLVSGSAPLLAQQEGADPGFAQYLFPPELVMRHQQRIGLKAEQRSAITTAINEFQTSVLGQQWKMQEETQRLAEMLKGERVDAAETLAQVDRVLGIEREIKRAHLALLIRIKNTLSAEQQATLRSLR